MTQSVEKQKRVELREAQLLRTIEDLAADLERVELERDTFRVEILRLNRELRKVVSDSNRVQVKLARAAMDSTDSYHAKVAELIDARANFASSQEQQRAAMTDERRVSEDLLQSIIEVKLDTIREQIEEIQEMKRRVRDAEGAVDLAKREP